MDFIQAFNKFYFDLTVNELRRMNTHHPYGELSYNSRLYLDLIAYTPDCTASILAQRLHVAKSAVTLKVRELEQKGLIKKVQSHEDKRVYYLSVHPDVQKENHYYDEILLRAIQHFQQRHTNVQVENFFTLMQQFGDDYVQAANEVTHV